MPSYPSENYSFQRVRELHCEAYIFQFFVPFLIEMQTPSSSEPHFIDLHREQLIQRTSNVEGVLDLLYGNILDSEAYERICSARTNPGKMRELYNVVPSWNRACKDKLYEALKLKNKFLIADLEGR